MFPMVTSELRPRWRDPLYVLGAVILVLLALGALWMLPPEAQGLFGAGAFAITWLWTRVRSLEQQVNELLKRSPAVAPED